MGIDGISGSGRPPPAGGVTPSERPSSEFSVERPAHAEQPDFERLERGELSVDQYVDARVDRAVEHLVKVVPADALDAIKAQLREQFESDPVLQRLLQRATGQARVGDDRE